MRIFQYILVTFFMIFLFYRMGILIKNVLKRKSDNLFNIVLNGFMLTIAVFEIITLPYNIFKLEIKSLYYIFILTFLILIILSFIINRKNELKIFRIKELDIIKKIKNASKKEIFISICVVMLIISQVLLSSYLYESNADDSFYVSWSEQAKELEKYTENDSSTGREDSSYASVYILNSWEVFNGFIARMFNIETASLMHTIYLVIFILISYSSYYVLLKKIDNKNSKLMLLILSIIFLFSGVSARFRGYTMLMRIWQGKTMLIAIFIPYILQEMIDVIDTKQLNKNKIILLIIANTASVAFNPIAIWIFPFIYLFFTIVMLFNKQIKDIFKMILVILPYLLLLPIYLKMAISGGVGGVQVTNYVTYIDTLKDFIRNGYAFVVLYFISTIYIIFKGNKQAKILFIVIPILTFLSLANPFISKYVQKYVTASVTYWRVFWLFPIELTISYAFAKFITDWKKWYIQLTISIILMLFIVICGKNMYIESGEFSKHVNTEKIPQYIIDETKFILDNSEGKVMVVAPTEPLHGAIMRQLSSRIILWYSRPMYIDKIKNEEERIKTLDIYNEIYDGLEAEELYEIFSSNNINFIIVDISNLKILSQLDENIAKIVYEDEYYLIIKNMIK